jgi:MSHA biogenesis protein MshJ
MAYLKKLEQLNWRIEWDTMTFTIEEYPQGLLTIDVYTYSNEKDWISV